MKQLISAQIMIPFIVSLSFFMEAVDSTVINTAIPAMSHSLQVEPVDLKVALISYLLSLAVFIPVSGWFADKYGVRKVFIGALSLFTFGSLCCGFADNLISLIISRFIQGMGGAFGLPVGRLIIVRTFGRENLIAIMSRVVTVGALGMMLGPVIGGYITHWFSWHWIFWINIPFGLLAVLLSFHWLKDTKPLEVPPLDKLGFLLFGAALSGFTFALSALSETSVSNFFAVSILLISIILFIIYTIHSRNQAHPVVKTKLLDFRTFQISVIGNLTARLGFGGIPFLVPLLLQIGLGFSAQLSGLLLAPTALGVLIAKTFSLPLLRTFGYKKFLIFNTLTAGASIWAFMIINLHTSVYVIAFLTFFYGFILSLQYSAMNSLAYAEILPEDLSAATSIMSTMQQLAQSFGVAVSAIFIRLSASFLSDNAELTPLVFHYTFFAVGLFTLFSGLIFLLLKSSDGQQMIV